MRTWFITSTTYGTWLPGDERGFVSNLPDVNGDWIRHNVLGTPYDANDAVRSAGALAAMKGTPIFLNAEQATAIAGQFHETARFRNWKLQAFAIMANHFHALAAAEDDVDSKDILKDLKCYASRRLNQTWPRPAGDTWWTESGSCRPVIDEAHFVNVFRYIADQPARIVCWSEPALRSLLGSSERGT